MSLPKATPAMQQYLAQKQEVGEETILLFRMGDFYETFYDDAKRVSQALGITLTARDKNSESPVPLAGIPYHALDSYLPRLIKAGYRVAISEQVEDPKTAKGVVAREVQRVLTPGTLTDDAHLDAGRSNWLLAIVPGRRELGRAGIGPTPVAARDRKALNLVRSRHVLGLAWLDLSTGECWTQTIDAAGSELDDTLARLAPAELLLPDDADPALTRRLGERAVTRRDAAGFDAHKAIRQLREHFAVASLEAFGLYDGAEEAVDPAVQAVAACLTYARETQRRHVPHVQPPRRYEPAGVLQLDAATIAALEIERTQRSEARGGALLAAIDRTRTAAGRRLLAAWLLAPLTDVPAIRARQQAIARLIEHRAQLDALRSALAACGDLQRVLARVAVGRATPRELITLNATIARFPAVRQIIEAIQSAPLGTDLAHTSVELLRMHAMHLDTLDDLSAELARSLKPDASPNLADGNVMADGIDSELDRFRALYTDGSAVLAQYQAELVGRTGIATLKIGYNQVFGYYIELKHKDAGRAPADFVRRQTLRDVERYVTGELQQHQEAILTAGEKSRAREAELFNQLVTQVSAHMGALQRAAEALAAIDVLASLAELARERRYLCPAITADPVLRIVDGRHPVLEQQLAERFVPNDVRLEAGGATGGESARAWLAVITGPNMAGKSTYIRQTALLVLLAQTGSFIPAKSAEIGVADRICARVGAADDISRGQSTFMVEMSETAYILRHATPRSLVVLDEIGRGTSTYDGLSLAWAIAEALVSGVGCRTLFATHYHELTELARQIPGVANFHVAIREWQDSIVFLHRIVAGASDRSYGLHVARLAGLPDGVVARATDILALLEKAGGREANRRPLKLAARTDAGQLPLLLAPEQQMADELLNLPIDQTDEATLRTWMRAWSTKLAKDRQR